MYLRSYFIISFRVLLLLFATPFVASTAQDDSHLQKSGKTVIWGVSQYSYEEFLIPVVISKASIYPIVILDRGNYTPPPSYSPYDNAPVDSQLAPFIATYYRPGQTYRLLFGGGEVGTVTIIECDSSSYASVKLQTYIINTDKVYALATNSDSLGRKQSSRRACTESERKAALELAKEIYRQNSVPVRLLQNISVTDLTATDLNGDSNYELIGSFKMVSDNTHVLFLIIERQYDSYKAGLIWYRHYWADDSPNTHEQVFIDQLDLDADGIDEVITENSYYEGHNYTIYKKQYGQWREIYSGGGW